MMPGTPHGISDHQPVRERTAVMGTGGADRKEIIAALHEQHELFFNIAAIHRARKLSEDKLPSPAIAHGGRRRAEPQGAAATAATP